MLTIVPYRDIAASQQRNAEIDDIFFEASTRKSFEHEVARQAFHQIWLGRYLEDEPEHAFAALNGDGRVCGYLIGSIDDPAPRPEFRELTYFNDFAALTSGLPAHLHINVDQATRSQGVGAALIAAFTAHLARLDVPGVHVVTSQGARNVRFYERVGFTERGCTSWRGGAVVLLGRDLK